MSPAYNYHSLPASLFSVYDTYPSITNGKFFPLTRTFGRKIQVRGKVACLKVKKNAKEKRSVSF
jgi:hypothetical protein